MSRKAIMDFLPINKADLSQRGWDDVDVVFISGDAYVDHPSWAAALLGRFLVSHGFRVGILAQPDWRNVEAFRALGRPRLGFAISAGNMDSMVNHFTADKKRRRQDLYSPGGKPGLRPDRATLMYANLARQAYPGVPVIIGGVEASLRRIAHYDYWSEQVRRSILPDSKADLLAYGMGEYVLLEIMRRLAAGEPIKEIRDLRGSCYMAKEKPGDALELPSFEEVAQDPKAFSKATSILNGEMNPWKSHTLAQKHGERWLVHMPPQFPISEREMDAIYAVKFTRRPHPVYDGQGGIPALEPVQFSIVTHRGCFGGCSFCSLGLHQGKFIQSRSADSIATEAEAIAKQPEFKGTIPDVGGPSANMYRMKGKDEEICRQCRRPACIFPNICKNLDTDHGPNVEMLQRLRRIPGLKHIFVASGVRYDLILADTSGMYLRDLCRNHVSGQLKIAPEHVSDRVTRLMFKPGKEVYEKFIREFKRVNDSLRKDQYLVPYFITGHPGSKLEDTVEMAEFVRDTLQYHPEQAQNFTPTPMTLSTSMYHTGINPLDGQSLHVPRTASERRWHRALLQYRDPANRSTVIEALKKAGRLDLIGTSPRALVREGNVQGKRQKAKGKR